MVAFLFGELFGKKYKPPQPREIYAKIQAYTSGAMTQYVGEILNEQFKGAFANLEAELRGHFLTYDDSVASNQILTRLDALESIITSFDTFRLAPGAFLAPGFFEQPASFLLKKKGTNMCFGPALGAEGLPACMRRVEADCELYHLSCLFIGQYLSTLSRTNH